MKTGKNKRIIILCASMSVMLSQAIYMFYVTARSVVLPTILSDLGGMSYYSLAVILSSMTMAVTTPLSGKLGDLFGRKRIFVIGLSLYCVALTLCTVATNPFIFMLGIALSGISNGLLYPQLIALIVDIYPENTRPKMLGYASVIASLASIVGPILGGVFADFLGWRFVFIVMLPFSIFNLICAIVGMPKVLPSAQNSKVDYKGTTLFALCVMPFLYMLTSAGSQFEWISVQTLLLSAISVLCLILLLKEEKTAMNPIIPLKLFKKPIYLVCIAVTVISGICFSSMNYLPIYYQIIKGMSLSASGMMTLPRQVGTIAASIIIGQYLSKNKNYKISTLVPIVLFCLSLALMGGFDILTAVPIIIVAEFAFGVANGNLMVTPNSMGQHYLNQSEMGAGIAFISFSSTFGNSLGSALTGCIISQFWNTKKVLPQSLYNILSSEQLKSLTNTGTLKNPQALQDIKLTLPPEFWQSFETSVEALKNSFNQGLSTALYIYLAVCILLVVILIYFPFKKHQPQKSE